MDLNLQIKSVFRWLVCDFIGDQQVQVKWIKNKMGTKLYLLLVAELALMNVFVFGVKAQETTNITPGNSSVYEHSCDLVCITILTICHS